MYNSNKTSNPYRSFRSNRYYLSVTINILFSPVKSKTRLVGTHTPAREHLPRNNRKKRSTIDDMKFRCRFNATHTRKIYRMEKPLVGDIIKVPYGPINSSQPTGIPEDTLEICARWVESPPWMPSHYLLCVYLAYPTYNSEQGKV